MPEVASQTLDFVGRELNLTLAEARMALENYVEQPDNVSLLERCAQELHQVQGVLRVLEIYGAALLAEEMEQVAEYLLATASERKSQAESLDALMRAMVQLPSYLERVLAGGRDLALVLLPLLNDLRAVRGCALLSEGTLLLLNLKSDKQAQPLAASPGEPPLTVEQWARRLRARFQVGLIGWIRGERLEQNLDILAAVAQKLEQIATRQPVFQLWWVTGAVIEALQENGLEGGVSIKRLLGLGDREIRRLYEQGEPRYAQSPAVELLNNLLYYVGRAECSGPRVSAVRASFRLSELLPVDESIEQERENLSAPSVKLMQTVAAAIREDLSKVKDVLDIFVRRGAGQPKELSSQLEMLRKIGDTLGVLGLGELRGQVQAETERLDKIVNGTLQADEAALVQIAATLIGVEDRLDSQLVGLIRPKSAAEPEEEEDNEFQQVQAAVLRECILNLARIKEAITQNVGGTLDAAGLDSWQELMQGLKAGLLMLGKSRAVELIEGITGQLKRVMQPGGHGLPPGFLDRLADAIVSLEYYMETLQAGRSDPWYMLDNAQACVQALENQQTPAVPVVPALEPSAYARTVQISPGAVFGAEADPGATLVGIGAPTLTSSRANVSPLAEIADPELLKLFIEEAHEEVAKIRKHFPTWDQNPMERDSIITVRRSFHTLKGSGRMVGARELGEFAWAMENLLNRILDNTLTRAPAIVDVLREAVTALPELVEQLETGRAPRLDTASIATRAHALAAGRPAPAARVAAPATGAGPPATATVALTPAAGAAQTRQPPATSPSASETAPKAPPRSAPLPASVTASGTDRVSSTDRISGADKVSGAGKLSGADNAGFTQTVVGLSSPWESAAPSAASQQRGVSEAAGTSGLDFELAPEPAESIPPQSSERSGGQDAAWGTASAAESGGSEPPLLDFTSDDIQVRTSFDGPQEPGAPQWTSSADTTPVAQLSELEAAGGQGAREQGAREQATGGQAAPQGQAGRDAGVEDLQPSQDNVLRDIYTRETSTHVATVRAYLERESRRSEPHSIPEEIYRACHTLSGSSKMAQARHGIRLAEPLDRWLRRVFSSGIGLVDADMELLADCIGAMEAVVSNLDESSGYFHTHRALQERIDEAEKRLDQRLSESAEKVAQAGAGHGGQESVDEEAAADFDPEVAAIFTEEATELIEFSEQALSDWRGDPGSAEYRSALKRPLHTLKGGARMAGITAMGDLSHELETLVMQVNNGSVAADDTMFDVIQASLDELARMREAVANGRRVAPARQMIGRIQGLSKPSSAPVVPFVVPPPASQQTAAVQEPTASEPPAASDLTHEWGSTELEQGSTQSAAAAESSAAPSELPDTLIARAPPFAFGEGAASEPVSGSVAAELEGAYLEASEQARSSEEEREQAHAIEAESEYAESGYAHATSAELDPAHSTPAQQQEGAAALEEPEATDQLAADEETPPETISTEAILSDGVKSVSVTLGRPDARTADEGLLPPQAVPPGRDALAPVERQEMARVDADLLDQLLNISGEASIARSRMEQQLGSIDFNLGELSRTVTRLKEQLRNLEIETEAQILHRHEDESSHRGDFDPLELDRYSSIQQFSRALAETANDVGSIQQLLENLGKEAQNLLQQQARTITELQNGLMRTRMVPFQRHVQRLARIVRQAANDTGKRVELIVEGASGELDRQVLERMLPPFEHMLRNAVVHGIEKPRERIAAGKSETGRIVLELHREGAEVMVRLSDDGGGMNLKAIREKGAALGLTPPGQTLSDEDAMQLILEPGFSTAGTITQQAGRGVGMDVVATEIKRLGGALHMETKLGQGTIFTIRLPFTLAISHALVVRTGDEFYALPLPTVEGVLRLSKSEVIAHLGRDAAVFDYGGQKYRFQHLATLVGLETSPLPEQDVTIPVVLVRAGEHSTGLVADELVGSREIVVKSVGPQISSIRGISGATILGDGRIVIILDIGALVRASGAAAVSRFLS